MCMKYLSLYSVLMGVYCVEPSQKALSAYKREQREYLSLMYSVFIGAGMEHSVAALEALKCESDKYGTKLPPPIVNKTTEKQKKDTSK